MKIPSPQPSRVLALLVFVIAATLSQAAAARRPNFLFIYTDDQRWDAMGVVQREHGERGRFPWFTTPHMDRLAAGGVRFREAFVTLSLIGLVVIPTSTHADELDAPVIPLAASPSASRAAFSCAWATRSTTPPCAPAWRLSAIN